MPVPLTLEKRLQAIEGLRLTREAPLRRLTRFAIGGPASLLVQAFDAETFRLALEETKAHGVARLVIGGGTNLVVSDAGFDGVVLRLEASAIQFAGTEQARISVEAGASLQNLVDWTMNSGLSGMESLTGIPGSVGGAVYGNAGAYGRSTHELVRTVTFTDGQTTELLSNAECHFSYRESIFKVRKDWTILKAELQLEKGDPAALIKKATEIRTIRDQKYPPDMKCAGSIFKNLFFAQLPPSVQGLIPPALVREGKVPSAWFLEQTGARGMRVGDIEVAPYHANLIYNIGQGNSTDLVAVIGELKRRVADKFGFQLQEEVQYVGFEAPESMERIA